MSPAGENTLVVFGRDINKTFRRDTGEVVQALDAVSVEADHAMLTALVGPDGAGKTTLLRLPAGLMTADTGELRVLGVEVAADPQQVQEHIGYMPQKFGLYEDLTVQENLDLYADLHGVPPEERSEKYRRLMETTALGSFTDRLAGWLSGGMKQKLGLACTLVRSPELLLLDEPTVGVDPLSRRELWEIILQLVNDQGLTVLLSTSYLDEAERCGHVVLHRGKVLAQGRPADVSGLAAGLILLFGYGLSLDVTNVPVAIVLEDPSPDARELAAGFQLSPYFDARLMTSMPQAQDLMLAREVDGIVRIRPDFARLLYLGEAEVQVLIHGSDANKARIIQSYAQAAVGQWAARRVAEGKSVPSGPVAVQNRLWFNEANESRYGLVPGLTVLIMTLIGAMLTALVIAREWERGTLEALFVTPVRADEILLGKTIPYFALGMIGLALCLLSAKFLFHVPFRGSVWTLAGVSMLYLLVALNLGLLISSALKSQFEASQITLLVTLMPALMLSGFLFDLRSMPAAIRWITYALPARYYVTLLQTVFLAGDIWGVILPNAAVLAGMAIALLLLTRRAMRKRLD